MSVIAEVQKFLETWPAWKRLVTAAAKVEELERRVAELEGEKSVGPTRKQCPICQERRLILASITDDPKWAMLGFKVRNWQCSGCGHEEQEEIKT